MALQERTIETSHTCTLVLVHVILFLLESSIGISSLLAASLAHPVLV